MNIENYPHVSYFDYMKSIELVIEMLHGFSKMDFSRSRGTFSLIVVKTRSDGLERNERINFLDLSEFMKDFHFGSDTLNMTRKLEFYYQGDVDEKETFLLDFNFRASFIERMQTFKQRVLAQDKSLGAQVFGGILKKTTGKEIAKEVIVESTLGHPELDKLVEVKQVTDPSKIYVLCEKKIMGGLKWITDTIFCHGTIDAHSTNSDVVRLTSKIDNLRREMIKSTETYAVPKSQHRGDQEGSYVTDTKVHTTQPSTPKGAPQSPADLQTMAIKQRGKYFGDDPKGTWLVGWFKCPKHYENISRHVLLQPKYHTTSNLNCGMRYSPTMVRMEDNMFICGACGYWQKYNGPWQLGIGETDTAGDSFKVADIKQFYDSILKELGKPSGKQRVMFMTPRGKAELRFEFKEGNPCRKLLIDEWKLPSTYLQEGIIATIQKGESRVIGPIDAILWSYYIFLGVYYPPWFMEVTGGLGPVGIYRWEPPRDFAWIPGIGFFEDRSNSQHYHEGMTRTEAAAAGISMYAPDVEKAKAEDRRRDVPTKCPECGLPLIRTAGDELYCQHCTGILYFDSHNWSIRKESPRTKEEMEWRRKIDDSTRRR